MNADIKNLNLNAEIFFNGSSLFKDFITGKVLVTGTRVSRRSSDPNF